MEDRFLLFVYDHYSPLGGWEDLVLSSNDLELLKNAHGVFDPQNQHAHIVDLNKGEIILEFRIDNWVKYEE